jgi:hypothetical protein
MGTVAEIIYEQLGHKARVMLGAHTFVSSELSLRFGFRGCKKANVCLVILKPDDTYTVEFWQLGRGRNFGMHMVHEVEGVYSDSLHPVIESFTGLRTSL